MDVRAELVGQTRISVCRLQAGRLPQPKPRGRSPRCEAEQQHLPSRLELALLDRRGAGRREILIAASSLENRGPRAACPGSSFVYVLSVIKRARTARLLCPAN